MKLLKIYFPLIFILLIGVITHWQWFLSYSPITHGDWNFYFEESQREFFSWPYLWDSSILGGLSIGASMYWINIFWGLLSDFCNFALTERILYFYPSVIFGLIGAYFLSKKINKSTISSIVASFVYVFNTYFILGGTGHLTLMTAFAIAPIVLLFFIKTLEEKKYFYALLTGFFAFVLSAYEFRAFYITACVLALYAIYHIFIIEKKITIKEIFKNLYFAIIPIFIVFLLNFYWIFGFSRVGIFNSTDGVLGRGLFGNSFMDIRESFTLFHPFWTGSEYFPFVVQPIPFYFWLVPFFAFLGVMLGRKNKLVLFFSVIALIGILLTKQAAYPFPDLYLWLYQHVPGFNAFRESSKFYFLIALGYSIMIGAFVASLEKIGKSAVVNYAKFALILLIGVIFLWNTKPLITGEIKTLFVPRAVPKDYLIVKKFVLNQPEYFRTLWVPNDSRWSIFTNNHPKLGLIGVLLYNWKELIKFQEEAKMPIQKQIIGFLKEPFAQGLLSQSSVKYVIVPLEDKVNDDNFFLYYGKDRNYYVSELAKIRYLKKIDIGTSSIAVFENKTYKPHVYIVGIEEKLIDSDNYENIQHSRVNPTRYKFSVKNISKPFYLVFSESYHPDWKLRVGDFSFYKSLFDANFFLSKETHKRTDANLNSYYIDPDIIKASYPGSYSLNSDGSINFSGIIYFSSQSYLFLGFIVSFVVFLTLLLFLAVLMIKKRYEN